MSRFYHQLDILLIDDDNHERQLTEEVLRTMGHAVDITNHVSKALELVRKIPYDLILIDIKLKDANGLQLVQTLRALPDCRGLIPIIALTNTRNPDDVRACFRAGMSNFLPKPLTKDSFVAAVAPYLNRASRNRAIGNY